MKIKIAMLVISLIMAIPIFYFSQINITGNAIVSNYTLTYAICDENNFCQDYIIDCYGETLLKSTPISGAVIQHSENWVDSRNTPENPCQY